VGEGRGGANEKKKKMGLPERRGRGARSDKKKNRKTE